MKEIINQSVKMIKCDEIFNTLTKCLIGKGITVSTMESCTSGEIASLITNTPGSSSVFRGAIVAYSNDIKEKFGIEREIVEKFGVYSSQIASAMARAAAELFGSGIGIGVTGSLNNTDKNNADSIVGSVFFSFFIDGVIYEYHIENVLSKSRKKCKADVAYHIAVKLLEILDA